jgi:arginyl-tRNA synthetase
VAEKNPDLPADERASVARDRRHRRGQVRGSLDRPHQGLRLRLGPDAVLRRQHRPLPAVRPRPHPIDLPAGGVDRAGIQRVTPTLEAPEERALALEILGFEAAVRETLERWAPHRLCTYLFDLASTFTEFYEACPVLRSEEPLRSSRLALADLTARVLASGLGLLGIEAPERNVSQGTRLG